MREFFIILLVIGVLLVLTAVRYRKQIVAMIQVYRMIKGARAKTAQPPGQIRKEATGGIELVNCSKCGVWVPKNKAILFPNNTRYCSMDCVSGIKA